MEPKTQMVLIVLALICSITALVFAVNPGITGHATRDDIYYDDGYVGLGTTDPSYQLDVDGDSRFQDDLEVEDNLFVEGNISVEGHVGIGTDEPLTPLYITSGDPDVTLNLDPTIAIADRVELRFAKDGTRKARLEWLNSTNDLVLVFDDGSSGEGSFIIKKHGTVVMKIDNDGQVIIPSLATTDSPPYVCVDENGTLFSDPSCGL